MNKLTQRSCPRCDSQTLAGYRCYETHHPGDRKLYRGEHGREVFSETRGPFLAGLTKPWSTIGKVLKARSEGLGVTATCRVFDIAKNTLRNGERRLAALRETLMLSGLMQTVLSQVIEGDEVYTQVGRHVPVEDCEGGTIVLMERASRFIGALGGGKKDRILFFWAIPRLRTIIERTGAVTLVTDGARRYGNLLVEICPEVVRAGQRGRPPKVLRQGVTGRLKNKGSQSRHRGRKRPRYEAPYPAHPDPRDAIMASDIHAEHVEAFNASTRRRNAAYRRKTNT